MLKPLPAPYPPDPPDDLSYVLGKDLAVRLITQSSRNLLAYARLVQHIRILEQGDRRHMLWAGPVRSGPTPIPLMHRWFGRRNVPVHRILWEAVWGAPPKGNPRRLNECTYLACVSPMCFTAATPMEPAPLPQVMVRGRRTDARGNPVANYKVPASVDFSDRYDFKPSTGTIRLLKCPCGCGHQWQEATCPNGHPIVQLEGKNWTEHAGMQYRCGPCTKLFNLVRNRDGWTPRHGFRPKSATEINIERETREWLDSIPHEDVEDDDEQEFDEIMEMVKRARERGEIEPDD